MTESQGTSVRVVLTTAPSADVAERLATVVVEERLAACANVLPGVMSIYRWKGEVQRENEVLVIIKTEASSVERLRARVVELHPYEVPEVLSFRVEAGHEPYLAWVCGEVGPA